MSSNKTGFRQGRLGIGKEPIFPLDISGSMRIEGDLVLAGTIADIQGNPIEFGASSATFNMDKTFPDPTIEITEFPDWSNNVVVEGAGKFEDVASKNGDIYYNGGNVGIGTADPGTYKLKVNGKGYFSQIDLPGGDIQGQINEKQIKLSSTVRLNASYIGDNDDVSNTEYGYLNGVTSSIQTQLNGKLGSTSRATSAAKVFLNHGVNTNSNHSVCTANIGGNGDYLIYTHSHFCFNTNSGNVGIGTTSPSQLLHIFNNDTAWGAYGNIRLSTDNNNGNSYYGEIGYFRGTSNSTDEGLVFSGRQASRKDMVILSSNGNVGIGTGSPDALLDVNGHGWCRTLCAGSYSTFSGIDGGDGVKLQIGSSGYNSTFGIEFSGYTNSNRGENQALAKILCKSYDSNNGENHIIVFKVRGWEPQFGTQQPLNERFWFYGWGGATATAWNTSSDDRVKHNERNITNAMNIINKLNAKLYFKSNDIKEHNYNYDLDNSGNPITDEYYRLEAGFIAQEVREIPELKYCVEGKEYVDDFENCFKKDASGNNILDENNEPVLIPEHLGTIPKKLSLSYNDIFVYNVVATQELDKKVNVLESENAELKTKNTELENKVATLESELAAIKQHLGI